MNTIQARVNARLLTKANRLFTGTLQGRIIEMLQNARRAGATEVKITNQDGNVTVVDNGKGIGDFARLLDLGNSGWEAELEASEDPAGVGIFCLAPRDVTICSGGKMVTIAGDGWTRAPVEVQDDPESVKGTWLRFPDEAWDSAAVDRNAVFTGLDVVVDSQPCPRMPFVSEQAAHWPQLGCRIEVRETPELSPWHHSARSAGGYSDNMLINFHGQVVSLSYHPVSMQGLHYLVDLTGEPTGIRLLLPARTQVIENEALIELKRVIELEAYRFVERRGRHHLPFAEYKRAEELGIHLPEAEPTFNVGLLTGDSPEPIPVEMPKDFPLQRCYRPDPKLPDDQMQESNAHLLAALGSFPDPFVPVRIRGAYDGYSWGNLPTIRRVDVTVGAVLHESWLWSSTVTCVDALTIEAETSDGRTWRSPVCMAVLPGRRRDEQAWPEEIVYLAPEARTRLRPTDILYHLGGYSDDGDTWQTQDDGFTEALDRFWDELLGPEESIRRRVLETLQYLSDWQSVTVSRDGHMVIQQENGEQRTLTPAES